jgi:tetratricopeptide (TPR) repeat protein
MIGKQLGPYEIVAKIGEGGMGEVYRARDVRLDRIVAVKVLSAALKTDEEFRNRFEREARAVAALTHPHICTLFDVGRDEGVDYLVMEYLDGQTLADLLASRPLPIEEWLRLAIQVATALEAAHEQHVIHRDIKPGNIFVTNRGDAKVLDFGLAKQLQPASRSSLIATVAASGVLAGTIDYMSPEQARGLELDPRSDLFSFGIVLYEMATQRHPFRGADFIETLDRIANRPPAPITKASGAWGQVDRIVGKCIEKDAAQRYASASELLKDLRSLERAILSGTVDLARVVAPPRGRVFRPHARALAIVAVVVAISAGAALVWWFRSTAVPAGAATAQSPAEPPPGGVRARRAVAVLGLQNLSGRGDDAWLATALEEMLTGELGINQTLRVVAAQNIARVKRELMLADGTTLDGETLVRLRAILGADLVILGSYLAVPDGDGQLRVVLNVQDAAAGETVTTVSATGTRDGVLQIVSSLGDQLRQRLGIAEPAAATVENVRARLRTNGEALRLYSEGVGYLRGQEFVLARDALIKAMAADPQNAQIRSAMAEVWSSLGYDKRAQEDAAQAVELAKGLTREDRLSVEGRYHEMAQHWDEAIDRYRTLFGFFPDNIDYGISLASTLTRAGRPVEALATVAVLRNLPAPAKDDVRIDLAEADASHETSDFERELTAGKAAADRGLHQGARLLVAQGRLAQAQAHLRLGRPADASRLVESARQLFVAGGDRNGEARALNRIANIAYEQGDYDEAKRVFQEAEKVLRTVGNLRDLATALNNVADTMMMQDDLASASPVFAEALAVTRERGDRPFEGFLLLNLGDLAFRKGDLAAAESLEIKGLELARASGRPYSIYMGLLALGNVALAKDDLAGATMRFDEGLMLTRRAGDRRYTAYMLTGLGDVALADARIADARRHHQEALSIRSALGGDAEAAESRLALALLAIKDGRANEGVTEAAQATQALTTLRLQASQCYAWSVAAAASSFAGRAADARKAAEAAERLLPTVQTVSRRLWIAIHLARADASQGLRDRATASLREATADAKRRGFAWLAREGQRALSDIQATPASRPTPGV